MSRAFRLVTASGEVVECDAGRDPDLFQAQRVSLGAFGVMSRVQLSVMPAYRLRETLRRERLEDVLAQWDELADRHRHVEFWIFPYANDVLLKILEVTDEGDDRPGIDIESGAMQIICDLAALTPSAAPTLQRLITKAMSASTRAAPAYRIFPSDRATRFEEMEYEIPAAAGPDALRAAIAEVRERKFPIIFPFEFRTVKGDDMWLSPMNGRDCVSISFHQYAKMAWKEAFAAVEKVFAAHGGRPHWAKRHSLGSDDVLRLYPDAPRWGEVRKRVDPDAKFLNAHLRELMAFSL
jgi:FAD/FMN-containing dehydrogenase